MKIKILCILVICIIVLKTGFCLFEKKPSSQLIIGSWFGSYSGGQVVLNFSKDTVFVYQHGKTRILKKYKYTLVSDTLLFFNSKIEPSRVKVLNDRILELRPLKSGLKKDVSIIHIITFQRLKR